MKTKSNYFLLAGLILVFLLIIHFTDIYDNSTWFKAFLLILIFSFAIGGISHKNKLKK